MVSLTGPSLVLADSDESLEAAAPDTHTVWGLEPAQLHDRFWASRGVQVVRRGEPSELVRDAELFLLTDDQSLTIFRLSHVMDLLNWQNPDVLVIRLHDNHERGYRERVVSDDRDRFVRFERIYGEASYRLARVALTSDRQIAQLWQSAADTRRAWRRLRHTIPWPHRSTASMTGSVYSRHIGSEVMQFVRDLVQVWKRPDSTIGHVRRSGGQVWGVAGDRTDPTVRFIGPLWVGAGRRIDPHTSVVGPAVMWDDPAARPVVERLEWREIEPMDVLQHSGRPVSISSAKRLCKRLFDIAFSLAVLVVTLPFYPLVMLAIWLEDGRPFFFAHRRETLGGRTFPCLKFRSMRRDADESKLDLADQNDADGPQFYIDPDLDPRLTRIGRFIRKYNIDELPQFLNVLAGHMSVVGPRPSPYEENQYCPAWREARLSVRPGITGLWQVKRSRRKGLDFQEWIKYDIDYIQRASFWLDMSIMWETCLLLARGVRS